MLRRYDELDSLRGLAALTVLIGHTTALTFFRADFWSMLDNTPIRLLWGGHQAVVFFFLLSGFVLSLPFFANKQSPYLHFLVKRFFRIYIPYIAAILLFVSARLLFHWNNVEGYAFWKVPVEAHRLLQHVLLLGYFDSAAYDPVIWSLVHEMRISIVFPLMMFFVLRLNWKGVLAIGLSMSAFAIVVQYTLDNGLFHHFMNYHESLHYMLMFAVGALLAKHREQLAAWCQKLAAGKRLLLFVAGLLVYSYCYQSDWKTWERFIGDLGITAGATVLIVMAFGSARMSNVLNSKPLTFVGRVSYSLYLFHVLILNGLIETLHGKVPEWTIAFATYALSILFAAFAYRWLEKPAMDAARALLKRSAPARKNASNF